MSIVLTKMQAGRLTKLRELQGGIKLVSNTFNGDSFGGIDLSLNGSAFSFSFNPPRMDIGVRSAIDLTSSFNLLKGSIKLDDPILDLLLRNFYISSCVPLGLIILSFKARLKTTMTERDKIYVLNEVSKLAQNPMKLAADLLTLQMDIVQNPELYGLTSHTEEKLKHTETTLMHTRNFIDHLNLLAEREANCLISIEDANVASNFTGSRAVASALGVVTSNIPSSTDWYMLTPKTTMESYINRAIQKYAEILDIEEDLTSQNKRKVPTIKFIRAFTGINTVDDDVTDSVGHLLLAREMWALSEDIKAFDEPKGAKVSSVYLQVKKTVEQEYCFSKVETVSSLVKKSYARTKRNYAVHP